MAEAVSGSVMPNVPSPLDSSALDPVRRYLCESEPERSPEEHEAELQAILDNWSRTWLHTYSETGPEHALELPLLMFWRTPSKENALAYLALAVPVIAERRRKERRREPALPIPPPSAPILFDDYIADHILGIGGDGVAFRAYHRETGQVVTAKWPLRGEGAVYRQLGDEWHPATLRTYHAQFDDTGGNLGGWILREYADSTLADLLARCPGGLPTDEALGIFESCCRAVSWLHSRHIYRWSAHTKNVFRVGAVWKVGDFGRSLVFVPPHHPVLESVREQTVKNLGQDNETARAAAECMVDILSWSHPTWHSVRPYHPARERRLAMDDCAMLGGLLCDLLTGKRWEYFFRALNKQPYCSAHYRITGDRETDNRLSAIVNQAMRGDEGGGPLVANDGRGEQTVYTDALELLSDVRGCLRDA